MRVLFVFPVFLFVFGVFAPALWIPFKSQSPGLPREFIQKNLLTKNSSVEEVKKQLAFITQKYSSREVQWWMLYKTARLFQKTNLPLFCKNMAFLSRIKDFPLKVHARLHHYSHCDEGLNLHLSDFPEWLKRRALLQWHKKSKKLKDQEAFKESAYHLYELSTDKNIKEQYLLKALESAGRSSDPREKLWRKKLYQLSARYIPRPVGKQRLKAAKDFKKARDFKQASFYYRKVLNDSLASFEEKNESFKGMRWIYRERGFHKSYLRATRQWKNFLKRNIASKPEARRSYHKTALLLARSQWTFHQSEKALSSLKEAQKILKNKHSMFSIYRLKALIFAEQGKTGLSLSYFQKALQEKPPDVESMEKTKWNFSWALKKAGRVQDSIKLLEELRNQSQNPYLFSRVLFWLARTWQSQGKDSQAHKTYQQLIDTDPLSYYGILAHYSQNLPVRVSTENRDFLNEATSHKEYQTAYWLIAVGEKEAALDFLKFQSQKLRKKGQPLSMPFLYYMSRSQSFLPLFQMVGKLPPEERTFYFSSYTPLLFPALYTKEVKQASRLFNLEEELIYSVIRQESAYNPRARSPADAFGLMQLRPFVAKKVALKHGISYKRVKDLYTPKTNILLGTAFLKDLFKKYQFQFILALAAYNAGEVAVKNWTEGKHITDPLSFIEEIPYQETKTYIRLLIRNFVLYKLLNHPGRALFFPEHLLHIQQAPPVLKTHKSGAGKKRKPAASPVK